MRNRVGEWGWWAPAATLNAAGIHRRNFVLNVLDGAFFSFGLSFASRTTVLPVFVQRIGGDNVAIGLIAVLWVLGFNLPQLFIANHARQAALKKPLLLRTAVIQRLPWLVLALMTWFVIDGLPAGIGLILFFVTFGLAAAGGSLNLPVWFDLIAKLTPVRMRGRLFAVRTVVGAILGIFAGWTAEWVLREMTYPDSFALLFVLAFVMMMASYWFLTRLVEGEEMLPARRLRFGEFLGELPGILRRKRNYRNFVIAESLLLAATMAEAFFTVDAIESFGLSDAYAGRFTVVIMMSLIAGNLVFGFIADHFGHRLTMVLSAVAMAASCGIALVAQTVEVYYLAFAGGALTLGLRSVSRFPIIAELCGEEDRPTYVALSNVLTAPFVLSGLAAGWIANRMGYDVVFGAAAVVAAASAVWMILMVHEPRNGG